MRQPITPETENAPAPALDPAAEAALDWFARLRGPDVAAAERARFEAWRARPRHAEAYGRVAALWTSPELSCALDRRARSDAPPAARTGRRHFLRVAATVAAVLLATIAGPAGDLVVQARSDHHTATGERRAVRLGDGSTMVLNTGSAAAVDLDGSRRRVRLLAGEAFFEVKPDPTRPFEVLAAGVTARAVGTAFSLRAGDDGVRVTVRDGVVAVTTSQAPGGSARLGRGERVTATAEALGAPGPADVDAAFAWLNGRLIFHRRPLGEVAAELGRHHRGWIVVAGDRLRAAEVSGNYRLDDPAAVAAALAAATSSDLLRVSDYLLIIR